MLESPGGRFCVIFDPRAHGEFSRFHPRRRPCRPAPGLGDEFFLSVADALTCLEESPKQYPVYYREFRRLMTERFPYKIFFRINDDAVIVFRVLHAARDHTRELD